MKKILVADDSVTIQKVIALTFADEPVEIQSVGSGSDALDKMKGWRPDIVLADVIMPRVNGYELCRAIKEDESTRDIPVLLLAGTFEAFDEEEAKGAGANDFITKPFEAVELIEKVNGLMRKSVPETPEPSLGDAQLNAPPHVPVMEPMVEPIQSVAVMDSAIETAPPGEGTNQEPDIWDILSEADEMEPVKAQEPAEVEMTSSSIGPLEGSGVVDFGSFDVGLDRTEEPREIGMIPSPDEIPPPATDAAPTSGMPLATDGGSKIEKRERNFFGFETERTEPEFLDIMEEAVEEITFEVEEPAPFENPEPAPPDVQEPVPFEIPEPAPLDVQEPAPFENPEPVPQDARGEETGFIVPEPTPDESHETAEAALTHIDDARLESIIREVVEKRVEKIAWEVVPELSEILIKEAIEKIKGSGA